MLHGFLDWLDRRLGVGRMEEPLMRNPYFMDSSIAKTERKLKILRLRQELRIVDEQLKLLEAFIPLYPPQTAAEAEPSEVHTAPLSS